MLEVYLAGPEVFLSDAIEIGERKKTICRKYGLAGLFPLDKEIPDFGERVDRATAIYEANVSLMSRADLMIANLTPFRGPSMDPGTAFEIGFATARGIPVFGYTNCGKLLVDRVLQMVGGHLGATPVDALGLEIENFGFVENLMIEIPVRMAGGGVIIATTDESRSYTELSTFERCVAHAAKAVKNHRLARRA